MLRRGGLDGLWRMESFWVGGEGFWLIVGCDVILKVFVDVEDWLMIINGDSFLIWIIILMILFLSDDFGIEVSY